MPAGIKHTDLIQYNWYRYALNGFTDTQRRKYARTVRYYSQLVTATPGWANYKAVLNIYLEAAVSRSQGDAVQTDHMVPVNHPYVCGLHCEDNLQNIPTADNQRKNNNWWPNMWEHQYELSLPVQ